MSAINPGAVEINNLFREAQEAFGATIEGEVLPPKHPVVTDTRKSTEEFSSSRNAPPPRPRKHPDKVYPEGTYGHWYQLPSLPDHCHACREKFEPGQIRYTIMDDCYHRWGIASVCAACFEATEHITECSRHPHLDRIDCRCAGCDEPIFTPSGRKWEVCSYRCYQRRYRKRRRGRESVIDWKGGRPNDRCIVCKSPIKQTRKDAQYCSGKCRQWAYRRRKVMP
jgi:hypothetical protein